jgi:ABC-type amino acid transport substrate-binding protein
VNPRVRLDPGSLSIGLRFAVWLHLVVIGVLASGLAGASASQAQDARPLRFGWIDWDPYQYQEARDRELVLTGLDIELVREIAEGAEQQVEFEFHPWADVLEGLKDGTLDITVGYRRPERDAFVHYSFPYRLETEIIMVRRRSGRTATSRACWRPCAVASASAWSKATSMVPSASMPTWAIRPTRPS